MKRHIRRQHKKTDSGDLWMTSYADLISAVMAVLVLFVSFSKVDIDKLDSVQRAISSHSTCPTLIEIKKDLSQTASKCNIDKQTHLELSQEGLNINFQAALFKSGKADIDPNSSIIKCKSLTREIANISHYRKVDISGHTDDRPSKISSNWVLSAQRATSMHNYLKQFNLAEKGVRLIAYADTQPQIPIKGLTQPQLDKARAQNRRVSITIKTIKRDSKCH